MDEINNSHFVLNCFLTWIVNLILKVDYSNFL